MIEIFWLSALILGVLLYFLPWLVAATNKKKNAQAIGALNLLLGWTLVGWVVALVWALTVDPSTPDESSQNKRVGQRLRGGK